MAKKMLTIQGERISEHIEDGLYTFSTYAKMIAKSGQAGIDYVVFNDPDKQKNGYYSWDEDDYVQNAPLTDGVIEKNNYGIIKGGEIYEIALSTSKIGRHYSDGNLIGDEFEIGSILGDGSENSTPIRIKTVGYVELENQFDNLRLTFLNDLFEIIIVWYDATQSFISTVGYYNYDRIIKPPANAKYLRCVFKYGSAGTQDLTNGYINKLGISLLSEKYFNKNIYKYLNSREYGTEKTISIGVNKRSINLGVIYSNNTSLAGVITASRTRLLSDFIEIDNLSRYLVRYKNEEYTALIVQYDIKQSYIQQNAYGSSAFLANGVHFIRILIKRNDESDLNPLDSVYAGIEIIKDNNYNYTGNYLPANEDYWEQGSILNGENSATTSRLRTGKIPFVGGNYFSLEFQSSEYTVIINAYDKDDNWLGYLINYSTTNSRIWVDEIAYIRVVCKRQDGGIPMLPNMMNDVGITFSRDNDRFSGIDSEEVELLKLNVMSNNCGLFSMGIPPAGIPNAELTQGIIDWKALITENQQDIIFMQELPDCVDDAETLDTYETLYKDIYPYFTKLDDWVAIASKYPFVATQNTLSTGRKWLSAKINIQGKEISIANLHITPGELNSATRAAEIAEVIAFFANDENVIIGADLNTWDSSELDSFRNADYKLANWGYFGTLRTYLHADEAFDNILVKGGYVNKSNVSSLIATSDHYPIYSQISFSKL